jgi:hypothetical protein
MRAEVFLTEVSCGVKLSADTFEETRILQLIEQGIVSMTTEGNIYVIPRARLGAVVESSLKSLVDKETI